jgi:poly(A) polymerase
MAATAPPRLADAEFLGWPETRAVFAALAAAGVEARVVGGAVRNALLGRSVSDVDLATPALPQDVIRAVEAAGLKAIPTGIAHGTVTVVAGERTFEITTLRKDVETYGRHARVEFTGDWSADARRRDFTMNALYCDAAGNVFDPLGGYPDLANGRIRFIGDAAARISEDYLRILRFFRFAAEYGRGAPDAEGLSASVRALAGLGRLSPERIRHELVRLLVAPQAVEVVGTMFDYGVLVAVLGGVVRPVLLGHVAELERALARQLDPMLRLAALAVEIPEDADNLWRRLRLSNNEHARLVRAAGARDFLAAVRDAAKAECVAKERLYATGENAYRDLVLLAWARAGAPGSDASWLRLWTLPQRWAAPTFPLSGDDVMALGVPAGARVGAILRSLEAWWIDGGFAANESTLRKKLRALVKSSAAGN